MSGASKSCAVNELQSVLPGFAALRVGQLIAFLPQLFRFLQ